ncbi:MAG: DNA binding protein, excisionase family [Dehalococcoides mccartyi]|uniref:DNA binding protein, excisionase family n=2 Tax=Dehalococcoides mccartyi TaxID=61435 RepID=Q3Z841_DEHM1|nr:DNA binding protein, excisionase family [Dehalococcoides mccartyi 195]MCF7635548.1 DNA binding protein, excisionase family [Dehalococcoides mccartyi]
MKTMNTVNPDTFSPDLLNGKRLCLSVPEAAKMLGLSKNFTYELVRQGAIPSIKLGKRILISRMQLEEILKRGNE